MCFFISPRCLGVRANPNQINDGGDKLNNKVTLNSVCCSKVLFLFLAARLAATFGLGKMVIHAVSASPLYSIKVTDCHCMFIGYWCIFQTCAVSVHHKFHTHIYIWPYWPRKQLTAMQACANNFIAKVASVHLCRSSMKPLAGLERRA